MRPCGRSRCDGAQEKEAYTMKRKGTILAGAGFLVVALCSIHRIVGYVQAGDLRLSTWLMIVGAALMAMGGIGMLVSGLRGGKDGK